MKVLLYYPNWFNINWIPLGVSLLYTRLKEKGIMVKLFDTTFYSLINSGNMSDRSMLLESDLKEGMKQGQYMKSNFEDYVTFDAITFEDLTTKFIEVLDEFKPDLIAVSGYFESYELAVKMLKKSNVKVPVIIGGIDPTVVPDEVISSDCCDIICIGEGELPITELCDKMVKGKDYTDIKNLWVKQNGRVIKNELRNLMDLSHVPIPDFSIFDDRYFYQQFLDGVYRTAPYQIVRGCPYSCKYCNIPTIRDDVYDGLGKYLRRKSFAEVTKELRYIKKKYNIEIIRFVDDTFLAMSTDELRELADLYVQNVNLPFFINTRPETLTREKAAILKQMKCVSVSIGLEHGNKKIRKMMLRDMDDEIMIDAFKYLKEVDIRTSSQTMIGLPFENRKTIFETIELNRKCDADAVSAHIFYPCKGTPLRDICIDEGFIQGDEKVVSTQTTSILKFPDITAEKIEALKKTFSLYVSLPKILYPLLRVCEWNNPLSQLLLQFFVKITVKKQSNRSSTIKINSYLKEKSGLGLKEAKEAVDRHLPVLDSTEKEPGTWQNSYHA